MRPISQYFQTLFYDTRSALRAKQQELQVLESETRKIKAKRAGREAELKQIEAAKVEAVAEMDRRAAAYQVEDAALTAKIEERRRFLLDLRERRAGGHADLERLQREAEQAEAELAQAEARHEAELAEKVRLATRASGCRSRWKPASSNAPTAIASSS